VIGCLSAGLFLLRWFDLVTASLVAIALNGCVAIAAFVLSARTAKAFGRVRADRDRSKVPPAILIAIALSGFTALGAEVVWTRLLSLLSGATTYTFSMILAVFLAGLGIGSACGSALAQGVSSRRRTLGWVQLGLSFAIAYGSWTITSRLPYWPVDVSVGPDRALNAGTDLYRTAIAIFPGALLWGMSFPVAVAAAISAQADAAAVVGRLYAANTLGGIAGATLTSLVLIPAAGTQDTQRLLVMVSAASAAVALVSLPRSWRQRTAQARAVIAILAVLFAGGAVASTISPPPAGLIAWGRLLPWHGEPNTLYVGEGRNASVAVTEESNGWRNFHVSGKVEASTEPQDMRLQRLLAHLGALSHQEGPRSALVVGFGAGITAGALSIHPSIERLVICELEPLIPRTVSRYFGEANHDVATNLKVRIVYDDARHYVLTAREKFDVITSDPIHPWVKGAAALYTKEYFEQVRSRLNPGGIVTQWVPLYESSEESVRSVIATFFEVFPNGSIWRNDDATGAGYDAVLVGQLDARPIDVDAWQQRLDGEDYAKVRDSLAEVGFEDAIDVLATFLGRSRELGAWLAGAEINTDRNLRLQYLAGLAVNDNRGTPIRDAMLRYRQFPDDMFTGDPATVSRLREVLQQQHAAP
jgi:spermidine synthase